MASYDRIIFGMHHLNITQAGTGMTGRDNISHCQMELDLAGQDRFIDFWINKESSTYFKIIGNFGTKATGNTQFFGSCDAQGRRKALMCADGKARVLTLAMTHSNKDYKIGTIVAPGKEMYREGTASASGNHIHLEVAEGWVTSKSKNRKGYWAMANQLDPRNVFFILDGYTTVLNTQGLTFKHCSSVSTAEPKPTQDSSKPLNNYNLWYRAHSESIGWLDSVRDGMIAGTTGKALQLEAFKISPQNGLVLNVAVHSSDIGWQVYPKLKYKTYDPVMGSVGKGKAIEAIMITKESDSSASKGKKLHYAVHIRNVGWQEKVGGQIAGTIGKGTPIEAIKIWLE